MSLDSEPIKVLRKSSPMYADPNTTRKVRVGSVEVGGSDPVIIAGPCAVETREQTLEIAARARDAGAHMLRGGAYKPRTSPYAFQGLGEPALEILAEAREKTGLPIVTEVMDPRLVPLVASYADVLQIGTRNMQNAPLLIEAGKAKKPVLLKRGTWATLEEWIYAAEYVAAQDNFDIIMCERGIRTFTIGDYNRNTLDLGVLQPLRNLTYLPVVVDPSHAMGDASLVPWACHAAIACGAHGLIIEMIGENTDRKSVRCDGAQGIRPAVLTEIAYAARTCRMHSLHLVKTAAVRRGANGTAASGDCGGGRGPCDVLGAALTQDPAARACAASRAERASS
jgi:3-deoxy-7-phosphoheptulonate synthase